MKTNKIIYSILILLLWGCNQEIESHPPTEIKISAYTINEVEKIGTIVGILTAIDEDQEDSYIFSLVSDFEDNSSFNIIENELITNTNLDYETKSEYLIKINVNDGIYDYSQEITINIIDNTIDIEGSWIITNFDASTGGEGTDSVTYNYTEDDIILNDGSAVTSKIIEYDNDNYYYIHQLVKHPVTSIIGKYERYEWEFISENQLRLRSYGLFDTIEEAKNADTVTYPLPETGKEWLEIFTKI